MAAQLEGRSLLCSNGNVNNYKKSKPSQFWIVVYVAYTCNNYRTTSYLSCICIIIIERLTKSLLALFVVNSSAAVDLIASLPLTGNSSPDIFRYYCLTVPLENCISCLSF